MGCRPHTLERLFKIGQRRVATKALQPSGPEFVYLPRHGAKALLLSSVGSRLPDRGQKPSNAILPFRVKRS
jgi:hypothetical protein